MAKAARRPSGGTAAARSHEDRVEFRPLGELHLDVRNPRLGGTVSPNTTEADILETIVDKFGVEDVLSSLAVNGYFDAEPLVGLRQKGASGIRIVEGNRRLAACLILAGDPRAVGQKKRTAEGRALQAKYNQKPISEVPVLIFEESEWSEELLPYLGVRHIAASQPWDSYAKAAWIAEVLKTKQLGLSEVIQMIGDQHRTTSRLLEGFYFVNQLIHEARFKPSDSTRKGRGSNPEYPFSWVYTALGYSPVRRWLDLADAAEGPKENPVPRARLDDAEEFLMLLFGNRTKQRMPAIADSRQISELAKAVGDATRRHLLSRGKTVAEVNESIKPATDRIVSGLLDAQSSLGSVLVVLTESGIEAEQARDLFDPSKKVQTLARDIHKRITTRLTEPTEEQDE